MLVHDSRVSSRLSALLPAVGLCSCVVSSEAPGTAAPTDPEIGAAATGLIEREPEREPLTTAEAMIRSGRESLAAGHYQAAYAMLSSAAQQHPEHASDLLLDVIDAALGARQLGVAQQMIVGSPVHDSKQSQLQSRLRELRELQRVGGIAPCDAQVDPEPRPLRRVDDVFAAWNELRSGLPADHSITIPSTEEQALEALCGSGCELGEPSFAELVSRAERTIALVVAHDDGSFSILPDLLHTESSECGDETTVGFERHDKLVRVRAFADRTYSVDPSEWSLVELPEYGPPPVSDASSPSYTYASSGYQASAGNSYYYGSSGYNHGYGYGCGGGYDSQYTCEVRAHVERDVILDLDRGEIVLDIVRTGDRGSALGRVTMASAPAGAVVDVNACGVSRSLQLSYT
jgi:hypothetical protein